jgi:glycerophosphoryl diester phosphodiesterase
LGIVTALVVGVGLLSAALVASATMGRVCTDAKATADQNFRDLPFFAGLPPVLDIAHRGASKLAPEHSLAAYELALRQGADVLELDLRLLRDRRLVVAHDRTLERTLGIETAFAELTWAELAKLAGERMPLGLDQVFFRFPEARFNLELKDETLEAPRALAQALSSASGPHSASGGDVARRVLVASSHRPVLEEFRRLTGGAVATSASAEEALDYYLCQLMNRTCPVAYSALQLPPLDWLGLTTRDFIAGAHARGLAVHFWTVDEPARMRALLAAGADGVMTNRPDLLAPLIAERR